MGGRTDGHASGEVRAIVDVVYFPAQGSEQAEAVQIARARHDKRQTDTHAARPEHDRQTDRVRVRACAGVIDIRWPT